MHPSSWWDVWNHLDHTLKSHQPYNGWSVRKSHSDWSGETSSPRRACTQTDRPDTNFPGAHSLHRSKAKKPKSNSKICSCSKNTSMIEDSFGWNRPEKWLKMKFMFWLVKQTTQIGWSNINSKCLSISIVFYKSNEDWQVAIGNKREFLSQWQSNYHSQMNGLSFCLGSNLEDSNLYLWICCQFFLLKWPEWSDVSNFRLFSQPSLSLSQPLEVCPMLPVSSRTLDRGHLSEACPSKSSLSSLLFSLFRLFQFASRSDLLPLQGSSLLWTPLCRMPIETMQSLRRGKLFFILLDCFLVTRVFLRRE